MDVRGVNLFESERTKQLGRHGWIRLPALLLALLCLGVTSAFAETRSLKIHHLHTGEKAEIVFKRNGRYDQAGLRKINVILRDWRRNEPIKMDPRLLDLVWQTYRASGSKAYIKVVSGYRAPATNAMLRSRSKGVARKSQHMLGKAMDFFLPDVPLKKLRNIGLRMQAGGVGYYPNSGSPFIHLDVGNVRHWPGISRRELAGLFPEGKTLHVPSDGKPLPGYAQALAAYKTRQANGSPAIALASADGGKGKKQGLLAALFSGGEDEADDVADVARAAPVPPKAVKAAPQPKPQEAAPRPGIAIISPEKAQRAEIPVIGEQAPAPATKPDAPESIVASLTSVPLPAFAPRRSPDAAPETIPFGAADTTGPALTETASDRPQDAAVEMAALSIPLPTRRPDYQPAPVVVAAEEPKADDAVAALLAMNQPDDEPASLASQPVSASLPSAADRVRTMPKTGRVTARANQPAAPVVAAVPMQAGSWPLGVDRVVTGAVPRQKAPRLSANVIRTAPQHAYVAGFDTDRTPVDHQRFTGTAVNFLPVARFN
jgi:uncharacterized protein YcbK (DUF882 family)